MKLGGLVGFSVLAAVLMGEQPTDTLTIRPGARMRLAIDSPEIRRLIAEEEKAQAENDRLWRGRSRDENLQHIRTLMEHPDNIPPARREFLNAMAKAATLTVGKKIHTKVLDVSKARCLPDGISTTTFARVLIAGKKSPTGTQVWVCTNSFDNEP